VPLAKLLAILETTAVGVRDHGTTHPAGLVAVLLCAESDRLKPRFADSGPRVGDDDAWDVV
jgi:hypothetical protein